MEGEDDNKPVENLILVEKILNANRTSESLAALRTQALREPEGDLRLEEGLLMYDERLVVPSDHNLQTELIREAYNQISTAYPGRKKTHYILRKRYY